MLDHLGAALHERASGERLKRRDILDDEARLVERADEVLAFAMIDGRLAADRGVDHSEQRGRHLHERHAAEVGGRDEAGEVAHNAAAEGDDRAAALSSLRDEPVVDRRGDIEGLVGFAGGNRERLRFETGAA